MIRAALAATLALAAPALADDAADIGSRSVAFEEAYNGGQAAALAALYTEDAVAMPPGGPVVRGRHDIQAMWQSAMDAGLKKLDLMEGEIEVIGDTAIEMSTFIGTMAGEGGDAPAPGKFVVVWKKLNDEWLLHRDIWNAMPAE